MTLREKLQKDILLLDGAFGTYAHSQGLTDEMFEDRIGCGEYLSLTSPEFIKGIHADYLKAGSDAVETNTFGANSVKLAEYGLSDKVYEINLASTRLAREAADEASTEKFPRYVIASVGPTGKLPSSTDAALGNISYEELKKIYHEQALGIIDGGADAILIETGQDLLEMKAAVNGAKSALEEKKKDLVLMAQCTLANNGRMLLGTEVSAVMSTLAYLGVEVIGLNCSTGPAEMEGAVAYLSEHAPTFISCVPNAGLPVEEEGKTVYPLKPEEMAGILKKFVDKYHLDVIGGCCGTTPEHIQCMRKKIKRVKKRKIKENSYFSSTYKAFDLKEMNLPVKIGERMNTQGSRRMKELLLDKNIDQIIELGKLQQKQGADILDLCCVLTERNTEKEDAALLTGKLAESVEVPLMIDSTNAEVVESALAKYPGTGFINSANLEDGGKKAREIYRLAREHASFVVNLVIDEEGMAKESERKIEIAERLFDIATKEFGVEPHRLIFDFLTFSLGTGEEEYASSAIESFKAIEVFKKKHPEVLTSLGVSNVSFGFKAPSRKILNMVFLHQAVKHGLDMAIISPSEYVEYRDLPKKERALAEDLVLARKADALQRFIEHFDQRKEEPPVKEVPKEELPLEEKLVKCVIERDKTSIIPLVDEALKVKKPEEIINDILMDAMKEVGDKLDSGETVLPYVLQSAEVMRKAIDHLEKFLPKDVSTSRGKVLLATVQGDVHDIGKNLVKMILENNGFSVIDLGKQVAVEKIVEEAQRNEVDAVGLSALLVSTARYMKTCVQSMAGSGLSYPVLIGGAPTNTKFAKEVASLKEGSIYEGGVFYAKDAFTGLKIMQALTSEEEKKKVLKSYFDQFEGKEASLEEEVKVVPEKKDLAGARSVPVPPFYGPRTLTNIPADAVFEHLDQKALFNLSWGAKLNDEEEKRRFIEEEYKPLFHELKEETIRRGWLDLKAVYGYFKCRKEDTEMEVLDKKGNVIETISFPRSADGLSLTDYFHPLDLVVFQAVTVGSRINNAIRDFNDRNESTHALYLHGMSVHLAEALASYVHERIREDLKLNKNEGQRYSPGYPLWKSLEDQVKLFRILNVEKSIGVELTPDYQMVPEQSTTAMIVYSEKAEY